MSEGTNTAASTPPPVVIVFYTTGDSTVIKNVNAKNSDGSFKDPAPDLLTSGGSPVRASDWFRFRALTLATNSTYAFPGTSTANVLSTIQGLPADLKIIKVYFYGHGNSTGFMLGCSLQGGDIVSQAAQYLCDPGSTDSTVPTSSCRDSGTFFTALLPHLALNFQIGFLGCHMGAGVVGGLAKTLSHRGATGKVMGYMNETMGRLQNPDLPIDDPGQKFADWLMDDTDPKHLRAKSKAINNQLPQYDSTSAVTP